MSEDEIKIFNLRRVVADLEERLSSTEKVLGAKRRAVDKLECENIELRKMLAYCYNGPDFIDAALVDQRAAPYIYFATDAPMAIQQKMATRAKQ